MTEQKSSGSPQRAAVKRTGRLASKSPKSSNSTVTPPKAVATLNATKEEVRRRKNPFNDMLKHQSGSAPEPSQPVSDVEDAILDSSLENAKIRSNVEKAPTTDDSRNLWESTINDAVQRESEELVRQNQELRCRVAQLEEQLSLDHTRQGTIKWPKSPEEVGDLRQRLHAAEKESQERLHQLISLKSSISSLTRMQSQATDGDLVVSFSELANRVREWTVSNFRRTKLNFNNLPKETESTLHLLYPQYKTDIQGADKFALYQAIVSNSLMHIFESPLVFGLPASLAAVLSFADQVQDGGPAYCEWKRATIQVLESSRIQHDLAKERERLLHRILGDVCHLIFTLTTTTVTSNAQLTLKGIFKSAVELQQTIALQKARYRLLFFRNQGTPMHLDDRTMEAINDVDSTMDDDAVMETDRAFIFCAFPGLIKHGDEWGEHLEISNVLLKARVYSGFG